MLGLPAPQRAGGIQNTGWHQRAWQTLGFTETWDFSICSNLSKPLGSGQGHCGNFFHASRFSYMNKIEEDLFQGITLDVLILKLARNRRMRWNCLVYPGLVEIRNHMKRSVGKVPRHLFTCFFKMGADFRAIYM